MSTLDAALNLAEHGIPCFPCLRNKAPATPNGFYAATREPAELRALWWRYPGPLVGVPTGPVSGLSVLDIDPRHGGDVWLEANRHRLPLTRTHNTGSGGQHFLFRHAEGLRNSESKIAPGVDVRGAGGYSIWWPAAGLPVAVEAPPAPWPDWFLAEAVKPPTVSVVASAGLSDHAPTTVPPGTAERFLAAILRRVRSAPPGQRHYALRNAALSVGGVREALGISEGAATHALLDAVLAAGGAAVDQRNAVATIRWGLVEGARRPVSLRGASA